MINNFKRGEYVEKPCYEIRFFYDTSGGFAFPCDENGNIITDNPAAMENYQWCLNNPDRFEEFNHVVKYIHAWREPNTGTCHCGQEMELTNEYMGACECPKCGKWYNIWGQELNNPQTWSDGDDW